MAESGRDHLVFPLDVPDLETAERWVERLAPWVGTFKVGLQLFTAVGPEAVRRVARKSGAGVFLDLKLHDIPNTVGGAAESIARLGGVRLLTAHTDGGAEMLSAAVRGAGAGITILGVTRLTSQPATIDRVVELAELARDAGCGGVVCAAAEAREVRAAIGRDQIVLCPGIRPSGASDDDQVRVATVTAAIEAGADYVVVGRGIRAADDPERAAAAVCREIAAALS